MTPISREVLLLSKELRRLARGDPDVRPLMTIPGVGYQRRASFKAEIGELNRFRNGDHLAGYAGLVSSTRSSSGVARHGRITREGRRWLRRALVEATMVHVRQDSPVTRRAR